MAIPQWAGRQSLAQPTFNPTAAMNGANRAIGALSKQFQDAEEARSIEAHRQAQTSLAQQGMSLRRDRDEWDRGAPERAVSAQIASEERSAQARLAEEARLKENRASLSGSFFDMADDFQTKQLEQASLSDATLGALRGANYDDNQISEILSKAKSGNPELFLNHDNVLADINKEMLLRGENPADYSGSLSSYKNSHGMGAPDTNTLDFLQSMALANTKGGSKGSGSSSGSDSDVNFFRNIDSVNKAVEDGTFEKGSAGFFENWFGDSDVHGDDVTRMTTQAANTDGVRAGYIMQAIKSDMTNGSTPYDLEDVSKNPNSPEYTRIIDAAKLLQQRHTSSKSGGSAGGRGSNGVGLEEVINFSRGYQPRSQPQRQEALMSLAQSLYPDAAPQPQVSEQAKGNKEAEFIEAALAGGTNISDKPMDQIFDAINSRSGEYGEVDGVPSYTDNAKKLHRIRKVLSKSPRKATTMLGFLDNKKLDAAKASAMQELPSLLEGYEFPEPVEDAYRSRQSSRANLLAEVLANSRKSLSGK